MHAAATLEMIKRRFAGREADIEQAFTASESFRGLCTDYLACATALARWREVESHEARLRVREYVELLGELTQEIHARLPVGTGGGNGGGSQGTNRHGEDRHR